MIEWKWAKDGKSVAIDGNKFEILRGTMGELQEYFEAYEEAKWVYARLHTGDAAFMDGTADYENAVDRLPVLRKQLRLASRLILKAAIGINVFFNPPMVSKVFEKDKTGESFGKFVPDAFKHLAPLSVNAPPDPTKKIPVGDRQTTGKPSPVDPKTDPKKKNGDPEATNPEPVAPGRETDPKKEHKKEDATAQI